ncbi:MAG: DJ-1/PfpI family protein [Oscillospiraceae bacterium]
MAREKPSWTRRVYDEGKFVAAICAAPSILAQLGITDGRKATCYPGFEPKMGSAKCKACAVVKRDGTLITGRGPQNRPSAFALQLEALKWQSGALQNVRPGGYVYIR